MKLESLSTFLALAVAIPCGALAGNEGPGAPTLPSPKYTVAELRASNGALPPQYAKTRTVRIDSSGAVVSSVSRPGGSAPVTEPLAQLTTGALRTLQAEIESIEPSELRDSRPELPPCAGAGVVEHLIAKEGGDAFLIRRNTGCGHVWLRDDNKGGSIIKLLSAFLSMVDRPAPGTHTPQTRGDTLASFSVGGGILPPTLPRRHEARITFEGELLLITYWRDRTEAKHLLTFSPAVARDLMLIGQRILDKPLPESDEPKCYDAPSALLDVFGASPTGGKLVRVWQSVGCIETQLDGSPQTEFFKNLLRGIFYGTHGFVDRE